MRLGGFKVQSLGFCWFTWGLCGLEEAASSGVSKFFLWFGNWFCRHVWGSLRCACIGTVVPVDLLAL